MPRSRRRRKAARPPRARRGRPPAAARRPGRAAGACGRAGSWRGPRSPRPPPASAPSPRPPRRRAARSSWSSRDRAGSRTRRTSACRSTGPPTRRSGPATAPRRTRSCAAPAAGRCAPGLVERDLGPLLQVRAAGPGEPAAGREALRAVGILDHPVERDVLRLITIFPIAVLLRTSAVCRRATGADAATPANRAPTGRPVRPPAGVCPGWEPTRSGKAGAVAAELVTRARAGDGDGVPRADRALPPGAAGALLPDARLLPGRRGRAAGHAAGRLAGPRRVRGARLAADLALPDRHQPVPQRAPRGMPAPGQGLGRARRRAARADPARRGRLAGAVPRRPARGSRRTCHSARRPATSRPRPSRSRS